MVARNVPDPLVRFGGVSVKPLSLADRLTDPWSALAADTVSPTTARATATRIAQALVIPFLPGRSGRKRRRARAREALPPSGIPPRFRDRRYYPSASPTRIVAAPPGCCQVPYGAGRLPATVAGKEKAPWTGSWSWWRFPFR